MTDERLIVALDVHSMDEVHNLVETLGDSVGFYKVGMELFYSMGDEVIAYLKDKGKKVFLDLKLHDIDASGRRYDQRPRYGRPRHDGEGARSGQG